MILGDGAGAVGLQQAAQVVGLGLERAADVRLGNLYPGLHALEGEGVVGDVVVVEDIVDSGLTMKYVTEMLAKYNPRSISICTLLLKPGNLKVDLDIPYKCFSIPNDFILGYGLDYDGYGRNTRDIYTVVE